jgi:hypothetical protein
MPTNPVAPVEEPTRTQTTVRAVKAFTNRHAEVATFAAGVLAGSILLALARLLP